MPAKAIADTDPRETERHGVVVELTQSQVDQVVHAAQGAGAISVLLAGLGDVRQSLDAAFRVVEDRRMSRSLLCGLLVLTTLPTNGEYVSVSELARLTGMHTSTTHRYISTLVAAGFVERHVNSRRYRPVAPLRAHVED
jgi:hypothetical protein